MTPQLALEPVGTPNSAAGDPHLTEDQFGELLAASQEIASPGATRAEAHLLCCKQCTSELDSLRESLSLFREASTAHADNELRRLPQMSLPARRLLLFPALDPAFLAAAAAAIFLVALLPMQGFRQQTLQPAATASAPSPSAESDEALLEDVNREVSASVPTPMQALDDPTASASPASTGIETPIQNSDQRKD